MWHYRQAALHGERMAQWNLALCSLEGEGTARSQRWGRFWLARAAAQGHRQAKVLLRRLRALQ